MKFQVIGKNVELTDAIKSHLDNKINKIFPNADESTDVRISLCVEKYRHIADVTVKTKWGHFACRRRDRRPLYIDGQCFKENRETYKKTQSTCTRSEN